MAIEIRKNKAAIAQPVERLSCKQDVVGSNPAGGTINPAEYTDTAHLVNWTDSIVQKHKDRLAYQAAYQRDLRKAKPLGMRVSEYRKSKGAAQ